MVFIYRKHFNTSEKPTHVDEITFISKSLKYQHGENFAFTGSTWGCHHGKNTCEVGEIKFVAMATLGFHW